MKVDLDRMTIVGTKPPWELLCPETAGKQFASDDYTRTLPRLLGRAEIFLSSTSQVDCMRGGNAATIVQQSSQCPGERLD